MYLSESLITNHKSFIPLKKRGGERGKTQGKNKGNFAIKKTTYSPTTTPSPKLIISHACLVTSFFFKKKGITENKINLFTTNLSFSRGWHHKVSHPPLFMSASNLREIIVGTPCCSQTFRKRASYLFCDRKSWRLRRIPGSTSPCLSR